MHFSKINLSLMLTLKKSIKFCKLVMRAVNFTRQRLDLPKNLAARPFISGTKTDETKKVRQVCRCRRIKQVLCRLAKTFLCRVVKHSPFALV